MTYETDRTRYLTERHADLFDEAREEKLPVWAQIKLSGLRRLLLSEAANHDLSLVEIDRLTSGHHN